MKYEADATNEYFMLFIRVRHNEEMRSFARMKTNDITFSIRRAAFKVHSTLGPGLLESIYESALAHELVMAGHGVKTQCPVAVVYDGVKLDRAFRIDILVDDCVVVEIKSVDSLHEVYFKQLLSYIKLSDMRIGLLINFNCVSLVDRKSIFRIVNNL